MVENIKTFQINELEANFIIKHFFQYKKNISGDLDSYLVKLDESEHKAFVDELTNFLVVKGLDINDEPNEIGFQIERLIDIFNPYKIKR